jgi:thioredoxin reductase
MLDIARSQVASYPTVTFVAGAAVGASREAADSFSVGLASGDMLYAARLVLAYGVSDELPPIPGLAERWGSTVIHCPYCHGYEFSGQRLGVLYLSARSIHQAMLISEWGPTTLYLNGAPEPDGEAFAELRKRGIAIEPAQVSALHGEGAGLSALELVDGRTSRVDAIYIGPPTRLNSDIAEQLGCEVEEGASGNIIRTDDQRMTTVPGVYAAGDITRSLHNVTFASADGVMAGMAVHRSLAFEPST